MSRDLSNPQTYFASLSDFAEREVAAWLSAEELASGSKSWSEPRRRAHLWAKVCAKKLICKQLGVSAADFVISKHTQGPLRGKPIVCSAQPSLRQLQLSIAHSESYVATTICSSAVGIDLETDRPRDELINLAFRPQEKQQLLSLTPEERGPAITQLWCIKEAYSKWLGTGLRTPFYDLVPPKELSMRTGTIQSGTFQGHWAIVWGNQENS